MFDGNGESDAEGSRPLSAPPGAVDDAVVPAIPAHLRSRDSAWCPDAAPPLPGPDAIVEDLGPGEDDRALLRELMAADLEPLLVVPDHGEAYQMVRDARGALVRTVSGLGPGAALAGLLEHDIAGGLARAGDLELGEVAAACERLASWARGTQAAAITELSRRPAMQPPPSGSTFASATAQASTTLEVTDLLALTSRQAENLVAESVELVQEFAATHAAMVAGVIDERRARTIQTELRSHEHDVAGLVEATVLVQASTMNPRQLRRKIRQLLLRLAPVTTEERHRAARERRHVRFGPAEDGMTYLEALLPAEDAAALKAVLDAGQKSLKHRDTAAGDPTARTADQRRADVLARLAWSALSAGRIQAPPVARGAMAGDTGTGGTDNASGANTADAADTADVAGAGSDGVRGVPSTGLTLARAQRRPVTVNVTVPLTTLLGLDEHPGELDGYGPISADIARHLSTAGLWRWIGTDSVHGAALAHGRTRYAPTQDLIDHVILRDRQCRAPGCGARAEACELDHSVHYPLGPTAACNLGLFCKRHHLAKHRTRWRIDQPSPGEFRWISPTGRIVQIHRPRVGPEPPGNLLAPAGRPDPPGTAGQPADPTDDVPPF